MKQTAVEYLFEQLWETPKDKLTWNTILSKAKKMEKEQMIEFAEFLCTYPDKNKNVHGEILHAKSKYDDADTTKNLFEYFINNHYGK